jgi:hypothetical protein
MSPPEVWGPPIWTFFHTLAEKVNEEYFLSIKTSLFFFIKRICNFLPCPDCSQHANRFLAKVDINKIKSKLDFKNMLYVFHNTVNKRKHKPLFSYVNVNIYKNYNVGTTFNNFVSVYHTKGNMNLIAESFQRNLLVKDLKVWLISNHRYFRPSKKQKPLPIDINIENKVENNTDEPINVSNNN